MPARLIQIQVKVNKKNKLILIKLHQAEQVQELSISVWFIFSHGKSLLQQMNN